MDLQLQGKRVLVTGSSSGIGAGIASVLAAEGAEVIVHGRNVERTEKVAASLRQVGGSATTVVADLATEEGCAAVARAVREAFGGIDVLVNNAGGRAKTDANRPLSPPWLEIPWADWLATIEQNLGAAVRLIQHFVPGMKERQWGRIIQIGSASATQTVPDIAEYQAVKAAMVNMSTSLAKSLAHTGITVNTVTPGTIDTPAVRRAYTDAAEKIGLEFSDWRDIEHAFTTRINPIAVDHFGEPEDIGRVVALVASPLSGYMTGANYRVDGGQCRSVN